MTALRRRNRAKFRAAAPPSLDGALIPATPELAQHHDVDTRVGAQGQVAGWRVRTRLDKLLADRLIDAAEWQAGYVYRHDLEVGELGARLAEAGSRGGGDGCPTTTRLDALGRLHHARQQLSQFERASMDGCAQDRPWAEIAARLGIGWDAVRKAAVVALVTLAEHYRLHGSGRRSA